VVALTILIGAALLSGRTADPEAAAPAAGAAGHFSVAMAAILMAYNGWSYVSFVAGEVRDPERNLLRSLTMGMAGVMALYLSANLAYLKVLTIAQIAASERVGAEVASLTMGPWGGTFVALAVMMSITGAINGCTMTAARIPFAQARDGLFFGRFGEAHPRFQTPGLAIICGAIWTTILVVSGSYDTLYSYTILAAWIFYTMSVAAVMVLRRKLPNAARPYRMWGYPWTLAVFVAASVWFIADTVVTQPVPSGWALGIVAAGGLAYRVWRRR
jgi:APA family basic amino acid/polyamine antiporter